MFFLRYTIVFFRDIIVTDGRLRIYKDHQVHERIDFIYKKKRLSVGGRRWRNVPKSKRERKKKIEHLKNTSTLATSAYAKTTLRERCYHIIVWRRYCTH